MSDELQILKRHLGEVAEKSEFKAKELSSQINDANDFIGALQILDKSLKKIQENIQERNELGNDEEKRNLDAQSANIIQSCSFMGETLFDTKLHTNVGGQNFSFEIQNPLFALENGGYDGVLAYVEDKRDEIDTLLDNLGMAITLSDLSAMPTNAGYKNFKEILS